MSFNIRETRLRNEYQKVKALVDRSDLIHLISVEGDPPERYRVRFTCNGVASIRNDRPVLRDSHEVAIYLHAGYPKKQPQLKWMTPIFHPNIHASGAVCIGAWWAAKTLDELLLTLGEMVQYKNFDPKDPMNSKAAQWANSNLALFPIDGRPLKGSSVTEQIILGATEGANDDEFGIKIL